MNTTQMNRQFISKVTTTFHQPTIKLQIQRKQSLQFQKLPSPSHHKHQSTLTQNKNNLLSAYPLFQSPNKKDPLLQTITSTQNQIDPKTSMFLKSYHERLKRQRKKQQKLKSSLKNIHLIKHQQSRQKYTTTSYPHSNLINNNSNTELINSNNFNSTSSYYQLQKDISTNQLNKYNKKTNNNTNKLRESPTLTSQTTTPTINQSPLKQQILVFKKSQFLDTSNTQAFKSNKKDYLNDANLQQLLKQIYQIRRQQTKQIQKIRQTQVIMFKNNHNYHKNNPQLSLLTKQKSHNKDHIVDQTNNAKNISSSFFQSFISKYDRGFSLPMKRKSILGNYSPLNKQVLYNAQTQRIESKLLQISTKHNNKTLDSFHTKSQQKKNKITLQKLFNFKSIDPWQTHQHKQHHHLSNQHHQLQHLLN